MAGLARHRFPTPLQDEFKYDPFLAQRWAARRVPNLEIRLLGWTRKREAWEGACLLQPVGQRCHSSVGGRSAGGRGERAFHPVQTQSTDHASSNPLPFCTVMAVRRVRYCGRQGSVVNERSAGLLRGPSAEFERLHSWFCPSFNKPASFTSEARSLCCETLSQPGLNQKGSRAKISPTILSKWVSHFLSRTPLFTTLWRPENCNSKSWWGRHLELTER